MKLQTCFSILILCITLCGISGERSIGELGQNLERVFSILQKDAKDYDEDPCEDSNCRYPVMNLPGGVRVKGRSVESTTTFYEIRYAKSPVGERRFQPPVPILARRRFVDASVPRKINCFQQCLLDCQHVSEDCLRLTVTVPRGYDEINSADSKSKLPVMLWIHGGAYSKGSATSVLYKAEKLSLETNAIIVTANYRLGPFGFLVDTENGIYGNQGLLDQRMAMKWVQRNIGAFGGNKNKVTIFGESAGAQSVMFHLISKNSKPFFHRGIMQSALPAYKYPTHQEAEVITNTLVTQLKLSVKCYWRDSAAACLRSLSAEDLIDAVSLESLAGAFLTATVATRHNFFQPGMGVMTFTELFRPTVGSEEFPKQPLDMFRKGDWSTDKPIIIGVNNGEFDWLNISPFGVSSPIFTLANNILVGTDIASESSELYNEVYADEMEYKEILSKEVTDLYFACPTRALARAASRTSTTDGPGVFTYMLHQPLPIINPKTDELIIPTAGHGADVAFLFRVDGILSYTFSEEDLLVADMFSDYWGSFAHNGRPRSSRYRRWPEYKERKDGSWQHMVLKSPTSYISDDFKSELCDYWDTTGFY